MTANHQQSNKLFAKESKMRYFQCDYNHISEILLRASSRMDENYETTEKILEIRNLNVCDPTNFVWEFCLQFASVRRKYTIYCCYLILRIWRRTNINTFQRPTNFYEKWLFFSNIFSSSSKQHFTENKMLEIPAI